jgi:hypothetical protein
MGLPKGKINNPAGKPKGATNKVTLLVRERINNYIEQNFDTLIQDIAELETKDWVKAYYN